MNKGLCCAALALMMAPASSAQQSRQTLQAQPPETLQSEVLISTLSIEELKKHLATPGARIEDKSEVTRGEPVTALVRSTGCMKGEAGRCDINANVTVYKPDGSVLQEARALDLSTGRIIMALDIDANAATGLYRVVVNVRDLTARRFGVLERRFAVK